MYIRIHLTFYLQLEEYVFRDPMLFGDFRNAMDEEEVRYYEDLLDYEAVYFLFQEVSFCRFWLRNTPLFKRKKIK